MGFLICNRNDQPQKFSQYIIGFFIRDFYVKFSIISKSFKKKIKLNISVKSQRR